KLGNLACQRLLNEWLDQDADLHLVCANVLKSYISKLSQPLLTMKYFEDHHLV
ncbi:hypothetical protein ACJMK2_023721, partial [Sinanodonta woodiana]